MKKVGAALIWVLAIFMLVSCGMGPKFHVVVYGPEGNSIMHKECGQGETIVLPDNYGPNCRITDQNGKEYEPGASVIVTGDMIIRMERLHRVMLGDEEVFVESGDFTLPILEKEGFILKEILDSNGYQVWRAGREPKTVTIYNDAIYKYVWEKDTFTVTFAGGEHDPISVKNGEPFKVPDVMKEGGYSLAYIKDANDNTYKVGYEYYIASDLVLTCHWNKTYTVSLNGKDIQMLAGKNYSYSYLIKTYDDAYYKMIDGHRIKDLSVNGKPVNNIDGNLPIDGDKVITYTWQKVCRLTVSGLPGGDTTETVDVGYKYDIEKAPEGYGVNSVTVTVGGNTEDVTGQKSIDITGDTVVKYDLYRMFNVNVGHYIVESNGDFTQEGDTVSTQVKQGYVYEIDRTPRPGYILEVEVDSSVYTEDTVTIYNDTLISYCWYPVSTLTIKGDVEQVIISDRDGNVIIPNIKVPEGKDAAVITGSSVYYQPGQKIVIGKDTELTWTWHGPFKLGDTGPAGGIIVMVDETKEHGFKYMEIHPDANGIQPKGKYSWFGYYLREKPGFYGIYDLWTAVPQDVDNTSIGTGRSNTEKLISCMTPYTVSLYENTNSSAEFLRSNNFAIGYLKELRKKGFNDWFLPSKDELRKIYFDAYVPGLIEVPATNPAYWSSSEVTGGRGRAKEVMYLMFTKESNGYFNQYTRGKQFNDVYPRVRPVRTF